MVESGRVPAKGRIRASIGKLFGRVREKGPIRVSTEKMWNPCDYRKTVRASTRKGSNQCGKMVESEQVPGKCRIRARIEKQCGRVPEKDPFSVSNENW